jgi:hypothetical protein
MTSDESLDELLQYASSLGLNRKWLQEPDEMPHFEIVDKYRDAAIQSGAIKSSMKEIAAAASKIAKSSSCHNLCNPSRPAEGIRTPGY